MKHKKLKLRWETDEIEVLKKLLFEAKPISFISKILNRSYHSIAHKLNRMGLKHPYYIPSFEPKISPELSYALGAWMGDRTTPKKFGIYVKDEDFAIRFQECLVKILNRNINIKKISGRFFVQRIDKNFELWVQNNTLDDIKEFIVSGEKNSVSNFVSGFFDAEGTSVDRYVQVIQKNKEILEVCKYLLSNIGITSYLSYVRIRGEIFYTLRIEKLSSLVRFYNDVGFHIKRKQVKLKEIIQRKIKLQYNYVVLYSRFKELYIKDKKVSYMAHELNLSKSTIYNWINEKSKPNLVKNNIALGELLIFM